MPEGQHSILLGRLKTRSEFLRVRGGRSWRAASLVLQARKRDAENDGKTARFGFTATKRLGGAVIRNRARRRLKETVRAIAEKKARPGYDYVVIARQGALTRKFHDIQKDLGVALERVHREATERQA